MTQSLDAIRADWIVPLLKNRIVNGEFRGITLGEACSIIAALEAASADQSAGDGWKMVPVEPTEDMCNRGFGGFDAEEYENGSNEFTAKIYRSMISAAPASPIPVDRRAVLEEALKEFACKCPGACERERNNSYAPKDSSCRAHDALAASPSLANEKETPVTVDPLELGLEVPFFERSPASASKGPMEATIERVAKALYKHDHHYWNWYHAKDLSRKRYLLKAVTALGAMQHE